MPLARLEIQPGVIKDRTPYASKGRWIDTQWVRFSNGQPTKMGGWIPLVTGDTLPIEDIEGARTWVDFASTSILMFTTRHNLKIVDPYAAPPALIDITPGSTYDAIDIPFNPSGPTFSTAGGNDICTCTVTTNLTTLTDIPPIGTVVQLSAGGTIGGVEIPLEVNILSIASGSNYQFTFSLPAVATADTLATVGKATFTLMSTATLTGSSGIYGEGNYGAGPYGVAVVIGIVEPYWSYDTFGQLLIATHDGIGPVVWCSRSGVAPTFTGGPPSVTIRAIKFNELISADSETPVNADIILSSGSSRHIIVLGTDEIGGDYNPLLVRWASQESLTVWNPLAVNTAGSYPLSDGSYVVAGVRLRREMLIWTDTALYSMQYIGGQEVFGFSVLATNISIASARSVVVHKDTAYWMGTDKFYKYDGRVAELESPMSSYVTGAISEFSRVHAGFNFAHDEIMWFYQANHNNAGLMWYYALYNFSNDTWANGSRERQMWYDSAALHTPLASFGNVPLQHEIGVDGEDGSDDGFVAVYASVESADMDINDGDDFSFISRLIPDIDFGASSEGSEVRMEIIPRRAPGKTTGTNSLPSGNVSLAGVAVTPYTERVGLRVRARQVRMKVSSDGLGVSWALGTQRIEAQPDGKK